MIDTSREPSSTDLRVFAFGLVVLGAFFRFWIHFDILGYILMVLGGCAVAVLLISPSHLVPLYRGWLLVFAPIAWLVSHLVLGLVYYGLVVPIGLLKRVVSGSDITLGPDRSATSYWIEKTQPSDNEHYFRQY